MAATWVGTFSKRALTAVGSKVGSLTLQWVDDVDGTLYTYSEEYDGIEAPQAFKSRVEALRDVELARQAESVTVTTQLNNLMNG